MKIKTIALYEFEELSEQAKAKVLETERDINTDYNYWEDFIYPDWKEKLESMGFDKPDISFSGFWSQGDGASFTCKHVQIDTFITYQKAEGRFKNILKGIKADKIEVRAEVYRIDGHYSHEYTVKASVEVLQDSIADKVFNNDFHNNALNEGDELETLLTETVRDLSRKIYKELQAEYEDLTRDDAVIDTIKANEYTFRANGEMENS